MIKVSFYQYITILNVYTIKNSVKIQKQHLTKLKGEIDKSGIIVGNFSISYLVIDRTSIRKSARTGRRSRWRIKRKKDGGLGGKGTHRPP